MRFTDSATHTFFCRSHSNATEPAFVRLLCSFDRCPVAVRCASELGEALKTEASFLNPNLLTHLPRDALAPPETVAHEFCKCLFVTTVRNSVDALHVLLRPAPEPIISYGDLC